MEPFAVGTAEARPGAKVRGIIAAGRDFDGPVEIPIIVIRGAKNGPTLWIDGATHGDEPEGPVACWTLAKEINAETLAGCVVLAPVLNVAAAKHCARGNPLDRVNFDLNRIYPGKADGRGTQRLAWAYYQEFSKKADIIVSLHSGGSVGYMSRVIYHNDVPESLELAKAFGPGWDLLVEPAYSTDRRPATGTIEVVFGALGKPALVVELGGLCDSKPDHLQQNSRHLADGCLNLMRHLKMLAGPARRNGSWKLGREWIAHNETAGFWLPDPAFAFRKPLKAGAVLARIHDLYGDVIEEIKMPCDGETIGMRTNPYVNLPGEHCAFIAEIISEIAE
jgi:uncharacterized protein